MLEQLHHAESVGDGMVDLHDERRALARETLDDAQLPQRAILVEPSSSHPLRVIEYLAPTGTAAGQARPGVVVVHVDVGIVGPAWWGHAGLFVDDVLVEARDRGDDPFDDGIHAGSIRSRVEEPDTGDRGAQQRVAFDVPQHRVAVAHPLVVVQLAHDVSQARVCGTRDSGACDLILQKRTPATRRAATPSEGVIAAVSARDCVT